jgi:hypothetical protein
VNETEFPDLPVTLTTCVKGRVPNQDDQPPPVTVVLPGALMNMICPACRLVGVVPKSRLVEPRFAPELTLAVVNLLLSAISQPPEPASTIMPT